MAKLFANSGDPDQKPHSAASDLGLHRLPITLLGVYSGLKLLRNDLNLMFYLLKIEFLQYIGFMKNMPLMKVFRRTTTNFSKRFLPLSKGVS